jgi:chromosome segregation ATPase
MNMFNNLFSSQNINGDIVSAQFDKMKAELNKERAEKNKMKAELNKERAEKNKMKAELNKERAEKNKLEADRLKPRPYNEKVLVDIEQLKVKAQDDGKTLIHENQISTAGKVLEKWRSNKDSRFTIILGQTQVG